MLLSPRKYTIKCIAKLNRSHLSVIRKVNAKANYNTAKPTHILVLHFV